LRSLPIIYRIAAMQLKVFRRFLFLMLLFAAVWPAFAQEDSKKNDRPRDGAGAAPVREQNQKRTDETRYQYEFAQKDFFVSQIVIKHDALGRGQISFRHKNDETPIVDPVELSPGALSRIFGLWDKLRFLDSTEDYQSSKNFAHLGTYKLIMDDGSRQRTAEFNWSNNSHAWSLAQEYRRVADQAIFVFDMNVARENQPLNAPGLLNQLESLYKRNGLSDPRQLVPLLQELSTDEHIPLIARNQAGRLLKQFKN
jgi:hypothetical protein